MNKGGERGGGVFVPGGGKRFGVDPLYVGWGTAAGGAGTGYAARVSATAAGRPVGPGCRAHAHSEQNFAVGGLTVPQLGQPAANALPHSMQYFAPARFSVPQTGQVMLLPCSAVRSARKHTHRYARDARTVEGPRAASVPSGSLEMVRG